MSRNLNCSITHLKKWTGGREPGRIRAGGGGKREKAERDVGVVQRLEAGEKCKMPGFTSDF